jgi:pyrimidine operon attenuation protein/uracil phosphoribosyltransferase
MRSREVAKERMNSKTSSESSILVMDRNAIGRALRRMAHEIVERNPDLAQLVLAGIPSRGNEIAQRLASAIFDITKAQVALGVIDVAMHRDDVGTRTELPVVRASHLPLPLEDRAVIIVDDVLFTGRTVRAAMDAVGSFGRPARIQLAVLIDRGHRELPIRADYAGKNLPTAENERVRLVLADERETEGVWLVKGDSK